MMRNLLHALCKGEAARLAGVYGRHAERDAVMFETVVMGTNLEDRLGGDDGFSRDWLPEVIVQGHGNFIVPVAAELLGLPHAVVQVLAVGRFLTAFPSMGKPLVGRLETLRPGAGLPADPDLLAPYRYLLLSQFPHALPAREEPLVSPCTAGSLPPAPMKLRTGCPILYQMIRDKLCSPRSARWCGQQESIPILGAVLDGLADEQLQLIAPTGHA